jgi:MFS family permease
MRRSSRAHKSDQTPEAPTDGMRSLWRNRDFLILLSGETVSEAGSQMAWLVFPLVGYYLTHSFAEAALAGTANSLGGVATRLPIGALVDRWNRRLMIGLADVAALAVYGSLAAGLATHTLSLAELVAGALLSAIASNFINPAVAASLRTIVPARQLPQALSLSQAQAHGAGLLGPPVGGLLYAVSKWVPFAANAVSYAVSLIGITLVRAPLPAPRTDSDPKQGILREIAEGLRFLWSRSFFRALTASAAVVNFAVNALFLVLTLKMLKAGVPYAAIGLVYSLASIGGLAGSSIAPVLVKRVATGLLSVSTSFVVGLMIVPIAFTNSVVVTGICMAGAFFLLPASNSAVNAYQMAITPDRLQARMFSALNFGVMALEPLAPTAGGIVLALAGGRVAVIAAAVMVLIGALILLSSSELRNLPRPDRWAVVEVH